MLVSLVFGVALATNTPNLCSSELTGQGSGTYLQFNSYGACTGQCSGYAFAIARGNECWCSNEAPGSTTSVSDCSGSCPGFPSDDCGNEDEGLYGYWQIGNPSGTETSSSAQSTSSSSSDASSSSTTSSSTTSSTTQSTTSSSSSSPSSSSSSSSSSSPTSSSSSSSSSTTSSSTSTTSSKSSSSPSSSTQTSSSSDVPTVSYITVTQSNSIQTQTVTQHPASSTTPSSAYSDAQTTSSITSVAANDDSHLGFFHNKGAVAGVFVVVGLAALALIILALFCCLRRRRQRITNVVASNDMTQHSRGESFAQLENESQLVPIFDQRVDAPQMYMRWENNTSQQSLQDNQDYSRRVLRVANPDDE